MITTRTKLAALGASLAIAAAACGDDGSDAGGETDASAVETVTDTAEQAPATDAPMADDTMTDDSMDDDAMADGEEAMDEGMEDAPFGPACDAVPSDGEGSFAGMTDDPAATAASNNPLLSTLVTAVGEAGLVDTLNADGPFTIFAPTNDAFAAIPQEDLDAILADQELLTSILTYHVVAGESLWAVELGADGMATTVNGADLTFGDDGTTVNGVDVVCSNVMTANATVHIIDEVLLPPADDAMGEQMDAMEETSEAAAPSGPLCSAVPADGEGSFAGMTDDPAATAASNNPALSTLVSAVGAAGLVDTLNGDGPFTIFAPADPAFAEIPQDQIDALLADVDALTNVLTFHVVAGERLSSADLAEMEAVTTVQGGDLALSVVDDTLEINGQASVGCADVQTANATVHIIDGVLMPTN